jgi:hypothetical protein
MTIHGLQRVLIDLDLDVAAEARPAILCLESVLLLFLGKRVRRSRTAFGVIVWLGWLGHC